MSERELQEPEPVCTCGRLIVSYRDDDFEADEPEPAKCPRCGLPVPAIVVRRCEPVRVAS